MKTLKKRDSVKRIVIVDDHPMMREGLARLIEQEADLKMVGETDTAHQALDLIRDLKPDLVLVDITLPDKNGLELIKDIHVMYPGTNVLVISMHDEALYAERVLRAGGRGYIMKQEGGKRLMEAIRQVLAGKVYLSEKMAASILEIFSGGRPESDSPVRRLTDREFEVFQLVGQGLDMREIAERLHLSIKTAEVHRTNIKQKLQLKSVGELIRYAVRWVESNPSTST
jgi:DNA-binding NarL/FixJ family response regulator